MIDLSSVKDIYLYTGSTDFRFGIYGLSRLVLAKFEREKITNCLFIFCSKSKKNIKIIEFDETGVWLYYKKLNIGKFIYPDTGELSIVSKDDLATILKGLDFVYRIEGEKQKNYDIF